jgi:adenylylsulfate kinase
LHGFFQAFVDPAAMNQNIISQSHRIGKAERRRLNGHGSLIVWFTGLSGSGKSTIAGRLEERLHAEGVHSYLLDGDNIRLGLNNNLDFSPEGRAENIRRIGEVAKLFVDAGTVVLAAFISPFRADRDRVRSLVDPREFVEVFVNCPLDVCEKRDVKGLYQKARKGEIRDFTGIGSPFEAPLAPEVELKTDLLSVDEAVANVWDFVRRRIRLQP